MPEVATVKEVFKNIPEGKSPLESQDKIRWLKDVENDLKKIGVRRKIASDRDTWKLILQEISVLPGPYSQSREIVLLLPVIVIIVVVVTLVVAITVVVVVAISSSFS